MKRHIYIYLTLVLTIALRAGGVGTYYDYYDNFNNEPVSALSSTTGEYVFNFLPVNLDNLDTKMKFMISVSPFVKQVGENYGRDVKNGENVDIVKNFSIIWNHKKEFMPFLSYYTPYKILLTWKDETREIIKKRDAVSIGILSDLKKNQMGLSLDMLMSSYIDNQKDNGGEYVFRRGGFSARMIVNMKMNKKSSMFISAVSPVFFDFDIDDNYDGSDRSYFDKFQSSAGFNYKLKNYFATYSFVYRNFEKFYDDDDGLQLTYPWVSEHNFIFGYNFDKNLRLSIDYQILPSVFTKYMPVIGDGYRHTIGAFAGIEFTNIMLNLRYADSKLLSEDSYSRTFFQMDFIYKIK